MHYPEPKYLEYVIITIICHCQCQYLGAEMKSPQNCLSFHLHLKNLIPDAEGYYNNDHIITKIGTSFYDEQGKQNEKGYLPFSDFGEIIKYQFREIMSEEDNFLWEKFYGNNRY